jgi:predicted N-acetyltransferase YhbS
MNGIRIRPIEASDVPKVVALLESQWPASGWCEPKFHYFYRDYPEGRAIAMVALDPEGEVIAFFGAWPVKVSGIPAGLVLDVVVRGSDRRGGALAELVRESERAARAQGMRFLCGFANRRFAKVAERFFGWKILGYLRFAEVSSIDLRDHNGRFRFEYGPAWYRWKFGRDEDAYVRPFEKDGKTHHQVLKMRAASVLTAAELGVPSLHYWPPEQYSKIDDGSWNQPFVVHPLTDGLPQDLGVLSRWLLEMGDSDTFEPYRPWRN